MDSEGHGGLGAVGVRGLGLGDLLQHFYTSRGGQKSGKVAKWRSFTIDTQAMDLPIHPTMASGGERRDAGGKRGPESGFTPTSLPDSLHHFFY